MGWVDDYMPAVGMFGLQFSYATIALSVRPAMLQGLNPRVLILYRHAFATSVIAPIAYFSRSKSTKSSLGLRSFSLIFLASFIGVVLNQIVYFEGIYLASSSMASAMNNLVPAVTFVIAYFSGFEKVEIRSLRSMAKIGGTILCVGGAISMVLLKGPKLLHMEPQSLPLKSILGASEGNWLLGCLFLFASCWCWSVWLILQVPVSKCYPDYVSLSAWLCFFATLQSAAIALWSERNPEDWVLKSKLDWFCALFSGISGSAFSFVVQAWCISKRGPLFSAMFNPLCTVMVTASAALLIHEKIYVGSLAGAICVIIGLYIVLWGKAKDLEETNPKPEVDRTPFVQVLIEDQSPESIGGSYKSNLKEPLLGAVANLVPNKSSRQD